MFDRVLNPLLPLNCKSRGFDLIHCFGYEFDKDIETLFYYFAISKHCKANCSIESFV